MTTLAQVLLFRDEREARALGPTLWTVLEELALVWSRLPNPPQVNSYYLGTPSPASVSGVAKVDDRQPVEPVRAAQWQYAKGRYARTYDPVRLGEVVREVIHEPADVLLLIFDQEITPPEDWRYIIWDSLGRGAVVSVAPLDPLFWTETGTDRVAVLKHRVRTASLCAIGKHLGVSRCDNPECVFFSDVDSVLSLDRMVCFGPEHEIASLAGQGFEPRSAEPEKAQPLVVAPSLLSLL